MLSIFDKYPTLTILAEINPPHIVTVTIGASNSPPSNLEIIDKKLDPIKESNSNGRYKNDKPKLTYPAIKNKIPSKCRLR